MICPCSANTLRVFVRSITQLEVHTVTRQLKGKASWNARTAHAITSRSSLGYAVARQYSQSPGRWTTAPAAQRVYDEDRGVEAAEIQGNSRDGTILGKSDESAIADINPDALDSILAEAQQEDIYAVPDIPLPTSDSKFLLNITDDTPQSLMAEALEIRSVQKARKRDKSEMSRYERKGAGFDSADQQRVPVRRAEAQLPPQRLQNPPLPTHSTFPRLPRIAYSPLPNHTSSKPPPNPNHTLTPSSSLPPTHKQNLLPWQAAKAASLKKYPSGYSPPKRLSPDAISGIRALHAQMPEEYHTRKLAEEFAVSPEAISRILRGKWRPNAREEEERKERWLRRGESVWRMYAERGVKVPKRWREMGVGREKERDGEVEGKDVREGRVGREKRKSRSSVEETGFDDLVTLPSRQGGLYNIRKRQRSRGGDGAGFI